MRPPYEITSEILKLISAVSEKIGAVKASFSVASSPQLRKKNQIKTIHSSLKIEGNTLTEKQITALLENKRVLGPAQDIKEVQNAIAVYNALHQYKWDHLQSFLDAHEQLMQDLVPEPGTFRKEGVGIVKGSDIQHLAPPAERVHYLMNNLFDYLKHDEEITLIKSCVFHYEVEFIHPFTDGNGRMGRLWQTVILMQDYPMFQYLPFESLIANNQQDYYDVLSLCDKRGNSTAFIAYMLALVNDTLAEVLDSSKAIKMTQKGRLHHFCTLQSGAFTRKDYMKVYKHLSSASASRDLKQGLAMGLFTKSGDKNKTIYQTNND